jgi:hypothetical protein
VLRLTLKTFLALGLAAALSAANAPSEPLAPTAPVTPSGPQGPAISAAPTPAPSPTALPVSPKATPAALSPAAQALSPAAQTDEPVVPEEVGDAMATASQASLTDLKAVSSTVLAKLAGSLGPDQDAAYLDLESGELVDASASGAARVDATALFTELAHRFAYQDDKDARAALGLAIMKKDARAKEAKDLAYESKLADSVIAQLEGGDAKAKAQLQALAKKGNARARQYLKMDLPPPVSNPTAPAPAAVSPTVPTDSTTKTPAGASPTAKP